MHHTERLLLKERWVIADLRTLVLLLLEETAKLRDLLLLVEQIRGLLIIHERRIVTAHAEGGSLIEGQLLRLGQVRHGSVSSLLQRRHTTRAILKHRCPLLLLLFHAILLFSVIVILLFQINDY